MPVPKIDKLLGMDVYVTKTAGVGGVIRKSVEDFVVEEVLVDGSKAEIRKAAETRVLGASDVKQRYLLCVLVKRNWDTFITLKNIAKQLGVSQRQIHIAGIKDAKAVTSQHITVENCSMEDAAKVNIKDIEIRPVGYVREKLSTYYLFGNNFTISLKEIKQSKSTVAKRIAETAATLEAIGGIPNYFGHQRFGTTRPITHLVGKAIVEGDFEAAAMLFLAKPSIHEHPSSRSARVELQSTRNFTLALQDFPKQLRYERLMLRHLVVKPKDFIGAFRRLPVKLQALFVQAYQSYLFNRFLSARLKNGFSLKRAEVGDFVVNVERSGLPMVNIVRVAIEENLAKINALIQADRMRVALPLVGVKQNLSQGIMGQIEKQVLEEESAESENFRVDAVREMSNRGRLRPIVTPIMNFELLDVLNSAVNSKAHQADLKFMLLRGSYATVLLREIMKPTDPIQAGF
ncbi:MAG: tRNA pseudouridine(13) synthase TruD [Candidatus Bathyarchaeia archaeon]|nr:tRNA pseudouridine(13) synthase TruD [Candidatus Bathyarchaeia archaeon]